MDNEWASVFPENSYQGNCVASLHSKHLGGLGLTQNCQGCRMPAAVLSISCSYLVDAAAYSDAAETPLRTIFNLSVQAFFLPRGLEMVSSIHSS